MCRVVSIADNNEYVSLCCYFFLSSSEMDDLAIAAQLQQEELLKEKQQRLEIEMKDQVRFINQSIKVYLQQSCSRVTIQFILKVILIFIKQCRDCCQVLHDTWW